MTPSDQVSVRELIFSDHEKIVDYFLNGDKDFLVGMGVDIPKLPSREKWLDILKTNFEAPLEKKQFYYIIWLFNGEAIGHSNINKIMFGEEGYMHLHMWRSDVRKTGLGYELVKLSIPYYFDRFKLKNLYCEPYAYNEAPNKTLKKLGFEFITSYDTVPGWISFHQKVNRWCLTRERYHDLHVH